MTNKVHNYYPSDSDLRARFELENGPVFGLAWSPDSRLLAASSYAKVQVWDAASRKEIASLVEPSHFVWGLAWSPDGTRLAAAGQDGRVQVWDTATWQVLASLEQGAWAFCVAWSPDGRRLAAGMGIIGDPVNPQTFSGQLQIWETATYQRLLSIDVASFVLSAAWVRGGSAIAGGLLDGRLLIWDGETGREQAALRASVERSDVNGLALSPDGQCLATAHQDGRLRLWDLAAERVSSVREGAEGWLRGVSWSQEGRVVAAGGGGGGRITGGAVWIWSVVDGQLLDCLTPGEQPIWSAQWSPDGRWLAAGSGVFAETLSGASVFVYQVGGP